MKKILITGGAGFIGSHVVRLFVNKYPDYQIINLDKLTYAGNLANLSDVENKHNYSFIKGDIVDADFINELFSKKLASYASTLFWNETLRADTYKSKLDFKGFAKATGLAFEPLKTFGPEELEARQKLLFEICKLIWPKPGQGSAANAPGG